MFQVAAVIPTFKHFEYAKRAVRSFLDSTPDALAILVDDGSPDWPGDFVVKTWADPKRFIIYRFKINNKDLTRSWNKGLEIAREHGAKYTVVTNSDVMFIPGWWASMQYALDSGVDLAGPITNAAGHRPKQSWRQYFPGPQVVDNVDYLSKIAAEIRLKQGGKTWFDVRGLNGFCMAAKTAVWWADPHGEHTPFDPRYKMERNEDKLAARWRKLGRKISVVPGSFVFHYRGVSRGGAATRGEQGKGHFRPKGKR